MNGRVFFCFFLMATIHPGVAFAQDQATAVQIPEIIVSDRKEDDLRLKKEEINRVETRKMKDLQNKQAQTFAQLIDNEKGIDTQTSCAFCGAKRITINGLKGEHTTILIDGLPLHSTVSGFYGVEAIPLGGIEAIDIYRGAGAALTAPESIGGAVNIVTKEIVATGVESQITLANDGQKNLAVVGTKKTDSGGGFLLGLQHGQILPLDVDGNGVSEAPRQTTGTVISKFSQQINDTDDLRLRLSYGKLKSVGGSMFDFEMGTPPDALATSDDFEGRDVRKKFIGNEKQITENVQLDRWEAAAIYRQRLDEDSSLKFSLGAALQEQKAVYSHGYDYNNKDKIWVALLEYQKTIGDAHLLTFGLDSKNQTMDSDSDVLYRQKSPPLQQDDLSSRSVGGFAQDTWFLDDKNELSAVLRIDSIQTRWVDLDQTLDRTVVAPRFMYKRTHDAVLTSRLSAGIGYRSPLTLFESQHGTDHSGFLLDIHELETAQSLVYSLSGQRQDDFFELGTHITRLENMAYGVDRVDLDEPTVFKNADEAYTISVVDLSYGRRLTHDWTIEGLFEFFHYPSGYKEKLPVAAIEKRFSLTSNMVWGAWTGSQKLNVVAERDLSAYGYNKHYNIAFTGLDPLDPATFGKTFASDQKWQKSPTYFTLDLNFERTLSKNFSAGFALLNAFNYTQTGAGDSPTTWHLHGDHYHLDNFHIWGPLRGRQIFAFIKGEF